MSWCFEDEADARSTSILERLELATAHVPTVWPLEVANVLAVGLRRRRIARADAHRFLTLLDELPIVVDGGPTAFEAFRLAADLDLSSYDAAYVELAVRLGLPLASRDAKLTVAAKAIGLQVL